MNESCPASRSSLTMKRLWSADQRAGFGGRSPLLTHPTILSSAKGSHSMHRSTHARPLTAGRERHDHRLPADWTVRTFKELAHGGMELRNKGRVETRLRGTNPNSQTGRSTGAQQKGPPDMDQQRANSGSGILGCGFSRSGWINARNGKVFLCSKKSPPRATRRAVE